MSKKLIVNEGEKIKIINNVSKLVTRLADGNVCTWIPEDETQLVVKNIVSDGIYVASEDVGAPYGYSQVTVSGAGNQVMGELGEKSIDKNGTYIASSDKDGPFYGYSVVTVNVAGSSEGGGDGGGSTPVTGKDPDGDDAMVTVDDGGQIVTEKLPVEIRVITTPDNLEYEDGQHIVFDGLYVKAYLKDGTEWGVVPNTDLIKPVTVAERSSMPPSEIEGGTFVTSAGTYLGRAIEREFFKTYDGRALAFFQVQPGSSWKGPILVSTDPNAVYETVTVNGSPITVIGPYSTIQYEGVTIYLQYNYHYQTTDYENPGFPVEIPNPTHEGWISEWLSSHNYHPNPSNYQTIPLQWKRPGDKKVLETSFTITVS